MSELNEKIENILECINEEVAEIDDNERAMVMLYVMEIIKCSVDFDIVKAFKLNGGSLKEVVRCRDCVFKASDGDWCYRMTHEFAIEPNDFCSWGKRKDDCNEV